MTRATWIASGAATVATAAAVWLWVDNRALRAAASQAPVVAAIAEPAAKPAAPNPWAAAPRPTPAPAASAPAIAGRAPAPQLAEEPRETYLDRRLRRTEQFAAMFGRFDGESEADWQSRVAATVGPMMARPRADLAEARRLAEEKAGVTPEQRAGIDEVASGAYAAALDYTNAAIAAGTISPYRRDSTGLLEVVGGLGGILGETQGKLGGVLTPAQRDAMAAAGFDWGEYLGTMAPWEDLDAPPPPPAP